MDYTKELHELCETLSREVQETNEKIRSAGGKLSAGDVDYIDKLTHAIKSVKATIAMMDEEGYSGRYPYMMGGAYDNGGMGRSNRSYRRDSMGRYSGRYSRDSRDMAGELRELMQDAPDERTRQEFQRLIDKVESM